VAELQAQLAGPAGAAGTGLVARQAAGEADLAATKQRVADLEGALKSLNGTLETLTAELTQARRDLAAAGTENAALRQRVAQLESAQAAAAQAAAAQAAAQPATAPQVATPAAAAVPPVAAVDLASIRGDPAALAAEGRRLLLAGAGGAAEAAFTEYLSRYASRPEAPEMRYWLGESLYAQKEHADAAQAYIAALRGWPKSEWAPDALVKLSDTLVTLRQPAEACKSLGELDRRYATAPAPVKARAQQAKTAAKCK
jgi:tol-pal system protein YbgF